MGRLDYFSDSTGKMSQTDINSQDISNIVIEMNRNQDLLDALNNNLKIIARGSGTISWDGTSGVSVNLPVPVNANVQFTFLVYFTSSIVSNNHLQQTQYFNVDNSGNLIYIMTAASDATNLYISFQSYHTGTAQTFTYYYFIIQQPSIIS